MNFMELGAAPIMLAKITPADWVLIVFVIWGVVLTIKTVTDNSSQNRPLDKRMPIVDIPVEFLIRLLNKKPSDPPNK